MISKSDFMLFLDAPMHLWAKAHGRLETQPLSITREYFIKQGEQIETLAKEYLETALLPQKPGCELIWQPEYEDGSYFIRADALIWDQAQNVYDLYEIKSSSSLKKDYLMDATFQALLLESHLNLRDVYILYIDNAYTHTDTIDLAGFFKVEQVSGRVEEWREEIDTLRKAALAVTQLLQPQLSMACTDPKKCPCPALCHPNLPERHIYDIPRIGKKALDLREMGITAIDDVPANYGLSDIQRSFVELVKSDQPRIDAQAIRNSLEQLVFPLYFLDYETFNPAVPFYAGYHPYEIIVFQYSLHILDSPTAELRHEECLILDNRDPAPILAEHLLNRIGSQGSVIVWHKPTERSLTAKMAERCPNVADRLLDINDRLFDLKEVFFKGYYAHPDFHGSASLKAVLPVMCPELSYEELDISEGLSASYTWAALQRGEIPLEDREKTETDLRKYCGLDTFAMVAIYQKLCQL